jgi:hypothetical protein
MSVKSQARTLALAVGALLLPLQPACKKTPAPADNSGTEPATGRAGSGKPAVVIEGDKAAAAPAIPVGMTDPLARLNSATAKSLQRGYKALNAKNWEECAAAFSEVTAALPDYLDARYYTARALLNQAKPAEARQQLEELLKRNYVAYAGRAASSKDWLALRTSPEWEPYKQAEARIKSAYATGLAAGVTLVARTAAAKPVKYAPVADAALAKEGLQEAKLELKQEVIHFDPMSGRYRPLTHSEGKVVAAQRSPDGKAVIFALAERVQHKAGKLWFVDPQVGFLDLGTLELVGPVPVPGGFSHLSLGFSKQGVPTWATTAAAGTAESQSGSYQIDTAHTGAVKVAEDQGLYGERTEVWVDDLQHSERRLPADIKPSADLQSFTVEDSGTEAGKVVTSAVKLAGDSFAWAPGHKLLLYAGAFDACAALDKRKEVQKDKNGLFIYDLDKKSAQRIDAARTTYEAQWLSDDLLAYETGIDADSRVTIYNVKSGEKTTLATRHGGGLYGISAHKCEEPPQSPEEALPLPPPPPTP